MAKNILWVYGHHEHSGYARNSREFIKALNLNGLNVRFLNIGNLKTYPEYETMHQYEAPADFKYDLVIQNVVPPAFCRMGDVPNILMTVAETDSVDKHWVDCCNTADEVWTMSYYSKAAFVTSGVRVPIRITLMPIDIDSIRTKSKDYVKIPKGGYKFFANSEWTPRKGWDILLDAFYKGFHSVEGAILVIKTCCFSDVESVASVRDMIRVAASKYDKPRCKTILIYDVTDIEYVWDIYKKIDCFVLPSRGEGCGIPYLEAMSCGKPVLYPCKGGQVDYMNDLLCTPVNCKLVPAKSFPHNPNYNEKMLWIECDKDDLSDKMVNILLNEDKEKEQKGAELFEQSFGFYGREINKTVKIILEEF